MAGQLDAAFAARVKEASTYYNRDGARSLMDALAQAPLVAQGPMGSMFLGQPGGEGVPSAAWNAAEPQEVSRLHRLYALAGADVLITNTFQASAPALERDAVRLGVAAVNRAAVDCAREAHPRFLLGSMGPCGLEWLVEDSPEYRAAREAYREQALALLSAGVDALLLETFTSERDMRPALAGARDAADGMPIFLSVTIDDSGDLLGDGMNIEAAALFAQAQGVSAFGVNCCSLEAARVAAPRMRRATDLPLMIRPEAGRPHRDRDGFLTWDQDIRSLADSCTGWIADGVRLLGTCCGFDPRATSTIADTLQG